MLNPLKSSESTSEIINTIRELTNDTIYATFDGIITVSMNGKNIIEDETIRVALQYDGTNYGSISIFWENYGYKNYKSMGLHGIMSTQYQEVQRINNRNILVINDNYIVSIIY